MLRCRLESFLWLRGATGRQQSATEETAKNAQSAELDLTPQSFAKLHALVRPHDNEWRHLKVEWLTDVVAARSKRPRRTSRSSSATPAGRATTSRWASAEVPPLTTWQVVRPLYTDEAIKLLNEKFVCFAPGWYINTKDDVYQAAWKRFYVAKPRPDEGNGWLRGTQLVLMTSSGRLLAGHGQGPRRHWRKALQEVLDAYAKLPEAERRPEVRGRRDQAAAAAAAGRAGADDLRPAAGTRREGPVSPPRRRRLRRLAHARAARPAQLAVADGGRVQVAHSRRIRRRDRRTRSPRSWPSGSGSTAWCRRRSGSWRNPGSPIPCATASSSVTVEEVTPQTVRLRLHGSVLLSGPGVLHTWPDRKFIKNIENRYDARLEGVIELRPRARSKITRWDMAALGDYTGRWFAGNKGWKEATAEAPLPLGFAFELDPTAYELPPERRRPRSFMHAYIFRAAEEHYWDPDKWLEDWKKRQAKSK